MKDSKDIAYGGYLYSNITWTVIYHYFFEYFHFLFAPYTFLCFPVSVCVCVLISS